MGGSVMLYTVWSPGALFRPRWSPPKILAFRYIYRPDRAWSMGPRSTSTVAISTIPRIIRNRDPTSGYVKRR